MISYDSDEYDDHDNYKDEVCQCYYDDDDEYGD